MIKELSMSNNKAKWAIIDIGSNTIRLVIYQQNDSGKVREAENIKAVARLRHHLNNGVLEYRGIQVLVTILKSFREIVDFHGVESIQCVGTATIRQAQNKFEILKTVKEQTGFDMKILSEKDEAYLGFFAVIHTTPIDEGVTIDIGGGSTEITYFQNRELKHSHSFPFGVVSLKEQFMNGEKMTTKEKDNLIRFIKESFEKLPWLKNLHVPIIAIGGSARNVALIHQNRIHYPLSGIHQYTMSLSDLMEILSQVEQLDIAQLEKLEGLAKDRADIIVPAIEVFVQICGYVGSDKFMFSRKGLREGIYFKEYENRGTTTDTDQIVKMSIDELVLDYGVSIEHSEHVANLAVQLYSEFEKIIGVTPAIRNKKMVELSARVYYIGQYVDSDVSSQHTFYLLANKSIDGMEHKDRLKLALIASFKNNMLLRQYTVPFMNWFTKEELQEIRVAGALTKLASALDASKRGIIKEAHLSQNQENGELLITLQCSGDYFSEKYQAEKQIRHLEKAIKKDINLVFVQE